MPCHTFQIIPSKAEDAEVGKLADRLGDGPFFVDHGGGADG